MSTDPARRPVGAGQPAVIPGPVGPLEALVETPQDSAPVIALVCHPHPQHGGAMTNKVVHTLARAFYRLGATALRFNFRGVGASAGSYDRGIGEREDALAAVEWALSERPGSRVVVSGFSFGAAVAASIADRVDAAALVTVALPFKRLPADFAPPRCPWLIVHGEEDEIVSLADVERWHAAEAPGARFVVLEDATHFFHGKLPELGEEVSAFVQAKAPFTGFAGGQVG